MTAAQQQEAKPTRKKGADAQASKAFRTRGKDKGAEMLPHLENLVLLVRKVQRPELLRALMEGVTGEAHVPLRELTECAVGSLPIASRNALFALVANFEQSHQAKLERAAERINLLGDEYGTMAVSRLLDANDPQDAAISSDRTDKASKALHLFLAQEYPSEGAQSDQRFDHAETQHGMLAQAHSDKYSSHYIGPKGAQPDLTQDAEQALRERLFELFPKINPSEILIECFEQRDSSLPGNPIVLYSLTAKFNGKEVHFQKIDEGEVKDIESPAVTNVRFSWQSDKGFLSVFCDDQEVRPDLTRIFRDVVLGGNGDIRSMPMREFDLMGFSTPAMLKRFKQSRIEGIEGIEIRHLVVTKPEVRQMNVKSQTVQRKVENALMIRRHRFEDRDIYAMAKEVYSLPDLTDCVIQQVKLSMRIAKTMHRRAHSVSVQITAPNGFSDGRLTKDDSDLVFAQLIRLNCAREY